ncbi:DUF4253 domain-containing protein [Actinacidiphila glaucinigra]|uniref:DUF4253 domain-containing protein n=1 Tax=Actinacidiphila glaucinigra TaxID=235986 RepID=UPI003671E37C
MSMPLHEDPSTTWPDLPPGAVVHSGRAHRPLVWMSDGTVPDAAQWWKRLYADHARTGLYPVLLEYPDDSFEPQAGQYGAGADVVEYFRDTWKEQPWPRFTQWPGLAEPGAAADSDAVGGAAGELADRLVLEGRARCLALVQVGRSADVPAAVGWDRMSNRLTPERLSAVLRSWEERFGLRLVGFGHGSLYLSVAAPPTSVDQAHILTAEHYLACLDVFYVDPTMDWDTYPVELMERRDWWLGWD